MDGQEVQQVAQFNPLVVETVEFLAEVIQYSSNASWSLASLRRNHLRGILDFRGGFRNHHEQGSHDRGVQHEVEFVRIVVLRDFTFAYFPAEFLGNKFFLVFMDQDRRGIVFHLFPNVFFLVAQVLGRFVQQQFLGNPVPHVALCHDEAILRGCSWGIKPETSDFNRYLSKTFATGCSFFANLSLQAHRKGIKISICCSFMILCD